MPPGLVATLQTEPPGRQDASVGTALAMNPEDHPEFHPQDPCKGGGE